MTSLEELEKIREAMKGRAAEGGTGARLERKGLVTEVKWRGIPFKKMTPAQKEARIKYLWNKVRVAVRMNSFVTISRRQLDEEFLKHFAQTVDYDGVKAEEHTMHAHF